LGHTSAELVSGRSTSTTHRELKNLEGFDPFTLLLLNYFCLPPEASHIGKDSPLKITVFMGGGECQTLGDSAENSPIAHVQWI
jgi:hypothetical protein